MDFFRSSSRSDYDYHPSSRGLLLPLVAALGVLVLTATAVVDIFPRWLEEDRAATTPPVTHLSSGVEFDVQYSQYTGLIDPHNGDNGTDPAQTTTGKSCKYNRRSATTASISS